MAGIGPRGDRRRARGRTPPQFYHASARLAMAGIVAAGIFLPRTLSAQLSVTIVPPALKPGMGSLQAALDAKAAEFTDTLAALLDSSVDKPEFMRGFNLASSSLSLLPAAAPEREGISLDMGSAAAAWADSWTAETLAGLKALDEGSDLPVGLAVAPLALRVSIPLSRVLRGAPAGLDAGFSLDIMRAQGGDYGVDSLGAGIHALMTFLRSADGPFRFDGLRLELGADYALNALSAQVATGPVYQTVPIDPDGSGPLAPITATILVDPVLPLAIRSEAWSGRFHVSAGISLLRALSLSAGAGCILSFGNSGVSLDSELPIAVEGYLANLIESPGSITISGVAGQRSQLSLSPSLSLALGFRMGRFAFSLPLSWRLPASLGGNFGGGLGGGLSLGISL